MTVIRTCSLSDTPSRAPRTAALDIARGVAILGTLATNIWIFSHPGGLLGYLAEPTSAGAASWQVVVERVLQWASNGKFLGMLTLLFGVGLAIQIASTRRRGDRWPGRYHRRALVLLVDGLLHYLLVVEFDVLMGYACTSFVVAWLLLTSERAQRLVAVVCAGAHVALIAMLTWAIAGQPFESDPAAHLYRDGSWLDLVALRIDRGMLFRAEPILIGLLSIAMFLLGAQLWRAGLFRADGARLRSWSMGIGAAALPVDFALAMSGSSGLFVQRYVTAPLVALGLLALIAAVSLRRSPGRLGRASATVGRVALSAYMLQNLVASALFYGWGLNLGGVDAEWRLPVTVAAWLGISALMIVLASVWLRRFERGPLEWAMHAVVRGRTPR